MAEEKDEKNVCSICLDKFRSPKLLPCRHTFCKRCIRSHEKRTAEDDSSCFRCPICRTALNVPEEGIGGFCDNFFVSDVIPDNVCDQCSAEDIIGECARCDKYLCWSCRNDHVCKTKSHRSPQWRLRPFLGLDVDFLSDSDSEISETNSISSDSEDEYSSIPFELRDYGCKTIYKAVHDFSIEADIDVPLVSSLFPVSQAEMGATFFSLPYSHRYNLEGRLNSTAEIREGENEIVYARAEEYFTTFYRNEAVMKTSNGLSVLLPVSGCVPLKLAVLKDGRLAVLGKENVGPLIVVILDKDGQGILRTKTKINGIPLSFAACGETERLCIIPEDNTKVHVFDFHGKFSRVHDSRNFAEDNSGDEFKFSSVCVDKDFNFLIVDGESNIIHILSPDGTLVGFIVGEGFEYPYSIAIDSKERIWLGDREDGNIRVFSVEGFANVFDHPDNIQRDRGIVPRSSVALRNSSRYGRHFTLW